MVNSDDTEKAPHSKHIDTGGGANIEGSVQTGGGDFVGRDKFEIGHVEGAGIAIGAGASVKIYGDIHYYPIKLRAPLREAFDPLVEDRTTLFGGRETILGCIADFIQNPKGGYLVITAPAGFGKTALIANIVASTPEAFAYHFFTPLYGDGLTEDFFLRNVVEQMAQWHDHTELLPGRLPELRALYHRFIDQPLDRTQVLVLDGLDEVTTWRLAPYLSRRLPQNLHIILTVRDMGQDWMRGYNLPAKQVEGLPLGGLKREDVAQVLRAAGKGAIIFAEDSALLDEVMRVSAYQADTSLGADPFYMRLLAEDAAEGRLTPANISDQPQGLEAYLNTWWQEIKQLAGVQPAKDLFGTLTVALGPIRQADLEAINLNLVDNWTADFFNDVLGRVQRWVVGDVVRGYALAHPRLQQYMQTRIKIISYRDKLLTYCAKWPKHRSPYVLQYYVEHLAEAGRADELYKLVKSKSWARLKYVDTPWTASLIQDLQVATKIAGGENIEGWVRSMGYQLRRALIEKQMSLMSHNSILFLAKLGDVDRALDFAKRQTWRKFDLIRDIARVARLVQPEKAVKILTELAYSADTRGAFEQCTHRLAVAEEILRNIPQFTEVAQCLINEAKNLESSIPEPKLTGYRINWSLPILALSRDLEAAIGATISLPDSQRAQALGHISRTLPENHPAKLSLAEQALSIVEELEQTPEVICEKMRIVAGLFPLTDAGQQKALLALLESSGDYLQSIGEPSHYDWIQYWVIKKVASVNLDWAKRMILESNWRGVFDAWREVAKQIAKVDCKEAISILLGHFGNYAGNSEVLADIIKIVAVEQGNLKEAETLIKEYQEQLRSDLSEAYLALAEGYLAQGDPQTAQQIFREYVFVVDNEVLDRTWDSLQLAIIRRAGVFLSIKEVQDRLMIFRSDLREEKEEAQSILAIMAARQGEIEYLKKHYFREKELTTIAYELAKHVSPEAAKEYAHSRGIREWIGEGPAVYAHIALIEVQHDPTKLETFLEHFHTHDDEDPHHFCSYMTNLPHALEELIWANKIEAAQVRNIVEDIYPKLIDWLCPDGDERPKHKLQRECECYGKRDEVLAHLIGILAKVDPNRAEQMAASLPNQPVKVNALKQILCHTEPDEEVVAKIIKATQEIFEDPQYQAASLYNLAMLLPTTMAEQINHLINLAEPLLGDKSPQIELKVRKGEALMRLVTGVDQLENITKSLEAVEGLLLLDTRGVGKLRVFDPLLERAMDWPEQDKLTLLQYLWDLAIAKELLDVQVFIVFSIPLINSLVSKTGFWRLYDYIEWAYNALP